MVRLIRRMLSSFPKISRMTPRSGPPDCPLRATRVGNMSCPGLAPLAFAVAPIVSLAVVQSSMLANASQMFSRNVLGM